MGTSSVAGDSFWETAYPSFPPSGVVAVLLVLALLHLVVIALVVYGAVRLGVRHGRRDARRHADDGSVVDPPVTVRR